VPFNSIVALNLTFSSLILNALFYVQGGFEEAEGCFWAFSTTCLHLRTSFLHPLINSGLIDALAAQCLSASLDSWIEWKCSHRITPFSPSCYCGRVYDFPYRSCSKQVQVGAILIPKSRLKVLSIAVLYQDCHINGWEQRPSS